MPAPKLPRIVHSVLALAVVTLTFGACEDGDFMPRVSSPDWSAPQEAAGVEVRGRLAMIASTFAPVAEVRLRNTGEQTVTVTVPSGDCAIVIRGYPDQDVETPVWEPSGSSCQSASTTVVEIAPGASEILSVPIAVTAELQSILRRYRWILVTGTVRLDGEEVTMELGELLW
jgi:hypothetical protein